MTGVPIRFGTPFRIDQEETEYPAGVEIPLLDTYLLFRSTRIQILMRRTLISAGTLGISTRLIGPLDPSRFHIMSLGTLTPSVPMET